MKNPQINRIKELAKKYHISAYDIGKNTQVTITTARNILTDADHTTRLSTVRIVLEYLESFENRISTPIAETETESILNPLKEEIKRLTEAITQLNKTLLEKN